MEHIYISYCKKIDNSNFYFIKKFQVYPELFNIPPMLEGYGMHTNFDKACSLAGIYEQQIKNRLLQDVADTDMGGKVIEMAAGEKTSQKKRLKFL